MVVNRFFNDETKSAHCIKWEALHNCGDTIYDKYVHPSLNKIRAYNALKNEYSFNDTMILGIQCKTVKVPHCMHKLNDIMYLKYRDDIGVINASCHFFTTCATFEDVESGKIYIVKETHNNTYMCAL